MPHVAVPAPPRGLHRKQASALIPLPLPPPPPPPPPPHLVITRSSPPPHLSSCVQVPGSCSDPLCPHCPCLVPEGYPIDLEPLYLHAARYASSADAMAAAVAAAAAAAAESEAGTAAGAGVGGGAEAGTRGAGETEVEAAVGSAGAGESWCFVAPLPEWARPEYVAVPAGRGGGALA